MPSLRLITAPVAEPVSVETAKLFLRVDGTLEDTLITSLIHGARETGEELSRRAFITQTLEMTFDAWPRDKVFTLWRPPLQSVVSVKYLDQDGAEYSWTDFFADTQNEPGQVFFYSFPTEALRKSGAIAVRYVAGYGGDENAVPQRIKGALQALIAYRYENREGVMIPDDIRDAFIAERAVWFPT